MRPLQADISLLIASERSRPAAEALVLHRTYNGQRKPYTVLWKGEQARREVRFLEIQVSKQSARQSGPHKHC